MTEYSRGGIARLQAEFLDHPQGQPIDPTSISLSILEGATTIDGPWAYPGAITRDLIGLYHYDWTVPVDIALGAYTASWTAVVNGVERTGYENFTVVEGFDIITGHPDSWTTPAEVMALTGALVDETDLAQTQAIIDLFSGTTTAAIDNITARDLRFLKMAAGYQVVWQINQVDLLNRVDVKSLSQDGVSFTPADQDALQLAPLAKRCLDRLSWNRPQSLRVRGHSDHRYPTFGEYAYAWLHDEPEVDHSPDWRPV